MLAVVVFLFVAKHYLMPTSSMEPTLHCARGQGCEAKHADRFVVLTFVGYGRGDIVAFHTPEKARELCGAGGTFIKRIVALPGEVVSYRKNVLRVDGRRVKEPYVRRGRAGGVQGTWHVPKGEYFLLGDNRAASCDSRTWGAVPKKEIIGRIVMTYWPLGRISFH